jgi:hypothetical protein
MADGLANKNATSTSIAAVATFRVRLTHAWHWALFATHVRAMIGSPFCSIHTKISAVGFTKPMDGKFHFAIALAVRDAGVWRPTKS